MKFPRLPNNFFYRKLRKLTKESQLLTCYILTALMLLPHCEGQETFHGSLFFVYSIQFEYFNAFSMAYFKEIKNKLIEVTVFTL